MAQPSVYGILPWMTLSDHKMEFIIDHDTTSTMPSTSTNSDIHFPLLNLPVELQRLIFYHYFGGTYDITVDYERLSMLRSKFHILGVPSSALLRVSKHVHHHAAQVRRDNFSGRLILNSVFILVPLRKQTRFEWLRANTTILHFSDSSVHPERWSRYWDSFTALKRLEICFPKIKEADCEGGLEDVLSGREDGALMGSLDAFRMTLVDQLREDRLEVMIRQKFCAKMVDGEALWKGLLDVTITLKESGSEVVDRTHIDGRTLDALVANDVTSQFLYANGNVLDAGSHRSLWEWQQAMSGDLT